MLIDICLKSIFLLRKIHPVFIVLIAISSLILQKTVVTICFTFLNIRKVGIVCTVHLYRFSMILNNKQRSFLHTAITVRSL
jgi:hypothetical protein